MEATIHFQVTEIRIKNAGLLTTPQKAKVYRTPSLEGMCVIEQPVAYKELRERTYQASQLVLLIWEGGGLLFSSHTRR
jgi:hypothetical protein